tara:strand:- start:325 stop:567 length:243 start_codon:yes stop_codon:yes gene_type:complete
MKYSNIKRDIARDAKVRIGAAVVYASPSNFPAANKNRAGQRVFASDLDQAYIWLTDAGQYSGNTSHSGGWYKIPRTTDPI